MHTEDNGGAASTDVPMIKVAAVQCSADFGEVEENRQKLARLVHETANGGAKLVVLPELAIHGNVSQDMRYVWHLPGRPIDPALRGRDPLSFAETVPGISTDHFAALAKELGIYLTIPVLERAADDSSQSRALPRLYNAVCVASPQGKLVAHYRKLNPWPITEQSWATPGDRGLQTFDTEFGRIGLAICYDIHTILEHYAGEKLWALLFPSAWVDEEHPADWFWHRLPGEVAKFNHYLVGANWSVDAPQPWRGYGFSTIVAPDGRVLATAKSLLGSEIVYAELVRAKNG